MLYHTNIDTTTDLLIIASILQPLFLRSVIPSPPIGTVIALYNSAILQLDPTSNYSVETAAAAQGEKAH